MKDEYKRLEFAEFLDRLTNDAEGPDETFDLLMNHYRDEGLEEIRRRVVRLAIERDPKGSPVWEDSDREQLRAWARQLMDEGEARS